LRGKDVLVGCIDVTTTTVETPEEVAAPIRRALDYLPADRLYPCTTCGMVPLPRAVARGKLRALGAGARLVRQELGGSRPDRAGSWRVLRPTVQRRRPAKALRRLI